MIDEIMFEKAVHGDKESFYKLFEPMKETLYKVAYYYAKDEDDALDCVQEAIIKAIHSLKSLKEPQYFNTWITRIAINVCKDFIRKKKNIILIDINDYEHKLAFNEDGFNYDDDLEYILSKLTEKERDLINMRFYKDMSLTEISEKTEKPLGTIKSSLSRTLKKLKLYMEEVKI